MVTICKAGNRSGLKCEHKRNTETPQKIPAVFCALEMLEAGELVDPRNSCIFANNIANWEIKEGEFSISEVA